MLFSSLEFMYLFLPFTVILYFLTPKRWKNVTLLTASLIFYAAGEPIYILLMMATILVNFLLGLLCAKKKYATLALAAAVILDVSLLVFFKYYDFFAAPLPFLEPIGIALPIGISFYTFQVLSYVADVYRQDVMPARSFISFSAYVSLFPQLIAGPIVRYKDVDKALASRSHSFTRAAEGIRRFCVGLAKKVLLANPAGEMWSRLSSFSADDTGVLGAWLGVIFYAFQIYFDFSGYSDMAIGLGKIFGFDFPENFNYPYTAKSVTDFWRRWHITLSSFFREYVYIPLGGNRRGKVRKYLNLLAVWSLTGLWHGAAFNFLAWGLYYFILLALEKAFLLKLLDKMPNFIKHSYSLIAILFGWVIFAADTLPFGIFEFISRLIGISTPLIGAHFEYELLRNLPFIIIMTIASTPAPKRLFARIFKRAEIFADSVCFLGIILCTAFLVRSGYNPFLYFKF